MYRKHFFILNSNNFICENILSISCWHLYLFDVVFQQFVNKVTCECTIGITLIKLINNFLVPCVMSSGFISESEILEARRRRQEEWEKVRTDDQPKGTVCFYE